MTELTGLYLSELTDWCKERKLPGFRAKQIFKWIHQGADFDAMTNLPLALREQLKESSEHDVRVRLVLEAIRDAEGVELTDEDVEAEIVKYVERNGGDLEKFREQVTGNADMRAYFESMVKMQKTVKILKDAAVAPKAE